jgi:hypothetical protein
MPRNRWWQRDPNQAEGANSWRSYHYQLQRVEQQLDRLHYESIFDPLLEGDLSTFTVGLTVSQANTVQLDQLKAVLSPQHLGPPHGQELLEPVDPPELPNIPRPPSEPAGSWVFVTKQLETVREKLREKRESYTAIAASDREMLAALSHGYKQGEPKYVEFLASLSLVRHYLPLPLFRPCNTHYDPVARVILCDLEIPNFASLTITKRKGKAYEWVPVSDSEKKKANETILFSLCIRAAYLIARSDMTDKFDIVAMNARQRWFDNTTDASREGTVASMHALKRDLLVLQLEHVDLKTCFRQFKGVAHTPFFA